MTVSEYSTKQKQILSWWTPQSPYRDYRYILATGAVRSGKTLPMVQSFVLWALSTFKTDEVHNFLLAGNSAGSVTKIIVPEMLKFLEVLNVEYTYKRSKYEIHIGKQVYHIVGGGNVASQDKIQGITASGVLADEVVLYNEDFIDQMVTRCSVTGSKIWMTCNPDGPKHKVKVAYLDLAEEIKLFPIHMTMEDNPGLDPLIRESLEKQFTGVFYDRYILGKWVRAEGLVYKEFSHSENVVDIKQKGLAAEYYIVGIDYGMTNPTAYVLIGVNLSNSEEDPKFWLEKEWVWNGKESGISYTNAELVTKLEEFISGKRVRAIYIDPSAKSFKTECIRKGLVVQAADNRVLEGIQFVGAQLATRKYRIDVSCKETLREYEMYSWDEKASEQGADRVLKVDDHTKDAERYALFTHFKHINLDKHNKGATYIGKKPNQKGLLKKLPGAPLGVHSGQSRPSSTAKAPFKNKKVFRY